MSISDRPAYYLVKSYKAARLLNVSKTEIERRVAAGELWGEKIGHTLLVCSPELDRLVDPETHGVTPPK